FMVHAGLLPSWSMERARDLAAEVETALRGPDYPAVLAALSGDTPDRWVNDLQGTDRLRVIVNAMTRMRFCDAAGVMEFRAKGVAPPAGFTAWFDAPGRLTADVPIVCGHWSALGLHLTQGVVALDTGCVWGGQLTAVRLEDRRVFQVPCSTGHPGTG
ncbi:MAG: symmetrical bis(5'-nucleosyl)-tetraphosphatase, partial [Acidobacteriota bacterium]